MNNCQNIVAKVIASTQGGLVVFEHLFPQLEPFVGTGKMFKSPLREERTPSAHFFKGTDRWYLKDFGLEGKGVDCFGAYMRVNNCDFTTALQEICFDFGINVETGKTQDFPMPKIELRRACDGKPDGWYIDTKEFSQAELCFLGPNVTADICSILGYSSVERKYYVCNGKEKSYSSTPQYPMFARKCRMVDWNGNVTIEVTKLYEPRSRKDSKGNSYKFTYLEKGKSPGRIINGLYEIFRAKEAGETNIRGVICSGERDALTVASFGYYPIWFNSETRILTDEDMALILHFVDTLYYIPDIDETGKRVGQHNMRKFPELNIIWLPDALLHKTSDQRKPSKDLRDWAEQNSRQMDFDKLIDSAHTYKITRWHNNKVSVSPDNLRFMLQQNGYYKIFDKHQLAFVLVHIEGNVVEEVTKQQIRQFVMNEIQDYSSQAERDAVMNCKAIERNLEDIESVNLDFASADSHSQLFYCNDKCFVVDQDGINEVDGSQANYTWKRKVIPHDVTLLPPMFTVEKTDYPGLCGEPYFKITPTEEGRKCKLMQFLQCITCLHYKKIENGEKLSEKEEYENDLNLSAMLFNLGYLFHRHKAVNSTFAPYIFEYFRIEGVEANGGTGKSMLLESLARGMGYLVVKIVASSQKIFDDKFLYQEVERDTDIVYFDECYRDFPLSSLNSPISSGISVEKKNKKKYTLSLSESPKIAVVSNFDPVDFDASTERRISYNPVSHFFHYRSQGNVFTDSRSVADHFGMNLWDSEYPEEDWNRDINCLMQIVSFYLYVSTEEKMRIKAPMEEVYNRHNEKISEGYMSQFATWKFINDAPNYCNKELDRDVIIAEYNEFLRQKFQKPVKVTTFTKELKAWVSCQEGLVYNPLDKCTSKSDGRIKRGSKTYIYIRNREEEGILPL